MLSTIVSNTMVNTSNPRSAYHDHEVMKPQSVVTYNKSKAGVDKHDQIASYYPLQRKTLKWWKKMFFWLFQMGVVNAYKLYTLSIRNTSDGMSFVTYMITIAKTLPSLKEDVPTPPAANEPRRRLQGDHFPLRIPPTDGKLSQLVDVSSAQART